MEKIGIICEYNPLHNGHIYHIEKIKEIYPDSVIVLVLNGYFLERGDVSLVSKYNKTKLALKYGVDLVLELPCLYGTNSADIFAYKSVEILNQAGCEKIVFGSETDDVELLSDIADKQLNTDIKDEIKEELKKGANYPTALSKVLNVTASSNDILGIAYIKAIKQINPSFEAVTIKRTNEFNDIKSNGSIVSAQSIRAKLYKGEDIKGLIPDYDLNLINKIDYKKYFELVSYKIMTDKHLERYLGVDEGLENKLKSSILECNSIDELIEKVKSKRYTTSRIKRMLVHILLGIEKDDIELVNENYRILGFTSKGQNYLKDMPASLVYRESSRVRDIEMNASIIYYLLTGDESTKEEMLNRPIKEN